MRNALRKTIYDFVDLRPVPGLTFGCWLACMERLLRMLRSVQHANLVRKKEEPIDARRRKPQLDPHHPPSRGSTNSKLDMTEIPLGSPHLTQDLTGIRMERAPGCWSSQPTKATKAPSEAVPCDRTQAPGNHQRRLFQGSVQVCVRVCGHAVLLQHQRGRQQQGFSRADRARRDYIVI